MVKVHAPALSMEASGKLGNSLVFAKWKGRAYARSLVKPHNPKLPAQVGVRSMMRFLAQAWKPLGALAWGSWDDLAEATNISPFNAYVAYNMRRWRDGKPPTQEYPPAETTTPDTMNSFDGAAGERTINLTLSATSGANMWGFVLCRWGVTAFTPTWANCIRVIAHTGATEIEWVDGPLPEGTYYYRCAVINTDGVIGAYEAEIDVTIGE